VAFFAQRSRRKKGLMTTSKNRSLSCIGTELVFLSGDVLFGKSFLDSILDNFIGQGIRLLF